MTPQGERTGVVLMAYGTPARHEDIEAYYTDIRRGRPPTAEQLADLARRYDAIGGISPLAARTEAQRCAVQAALDAAAPDTYDPDTYDPATYDVVLGLKHAAPMIEAGVAELARRGVRRIVGLVLAPHYSGSSVGQYLERAEAAAAAAGLPFTGVTAWHLEPAYLDFLAAAVRHELAAMPEPSTTVLFTAHSLPARILAGGDRYPEVLAETAAAVAARCDLPADRWRFAYQSAGRTPEPWLGPDVLAVIDEVAAAAHQPEQRDQRHDAPGLLVCACGFVADHLEVLYDLDIEARRRAEAHGIAFARTACVNDDPAVMAALAALVRR